MKGGKPQPQLVATQRSWTALTGCRNKATLCCQYSNALQTQWGRDFVEHQWEPDCALGSDSTHRAQLGWDDSLMVLGVWDDALIVLGDQNRSFIVLGDWAYRE
jgi:hypothetical protein